jgi:3'-5' exonuclease
MFSQSEISRILFLDIETVRGSHSFEELSEPMQEMWALKSETLKIKEESEAEPWTPEQKYTERAAIYAEFGRIVCISFGFIFWRNDQSPQLKVKSFYGTDEREILLQFKDLLEQKFNGWQLCAHNGREFDFPYICRRFLINQIPIPRLMQVQGKKPWELPYLDTMELWKFGDFKNYTKLELLCHVFGIPSPKTDMDGSQVGKVFWEEGDVKRIADYCAQDVIATAQLMLKYACMPLIEPSSIEVMNE